MMWMTRRVRFGRHSSRHQQRQATLRQPQRRVRQLPPPAEGQPLARAAAPATADAAIHQQRRCCCCCWQSRRWRLRPPPARSPAGAGWRGGRLAPTAAARGQRPQGRRQPRVGWRAGWHPRTRGRAAPRRQRRPCRRVRAGTRSTRAASRARSCTRGRSGRCSRRTCAPPQPRPRSRSRTTCRPARRRKAAARSCRPSSPTRAEAWTPAMARGAGGGRGVAVQSAVSAAMERLVVHRRRAAQRRVEDRCCPAHLLEPVFPQERERSVDVKHLFKGRHRGGCSGAADTAASLADGQQFACDERAV